MVRSAPKTKRSRQKRPSPSQAPAKGLSAKEFAVTCERMELYDSFEPQIRALIQEYGLKKALPVARQYYGRWEQARKVLEDERKALQLSRLRNI